VSARCFVPGLLTDLVRCGLHPENSAEVRESPTLGDLPRETGTRAVEKSI
jgi:hypothetical protein